MGISETIREGGHWTAVVTLLIESLSFKSKKTVKGQQDRRFMKK